MGIGKLYVFLFRGITINCKYVHIFFMCVTGFVKSQHMVCTEIFRIKTWYKIAFHKKLDDLIETMI